jgi:hypothetical protein
MKEGYSLELFEKLYKEITPLKKKLAYEIDHRRYGVTRDIIESWFDDKFIFVFNKHFNNLEEGHLKGTLINSLKTFKLRVLRKAYSGEGVFYSNTVDLEGESMLINYIADKEDITTGELFLDIATEFMKKELSDNAFMLLNLQLNPPPFILNRITKSNSNIPIYLILEYFGLDNIAKNIKMIRNLRKEINNAIEKAKLELNPA